MSFTHDHERVTRGAAVHTTQLEKEQEVAEQEQEQQEKDQAIFKLDAEFEARCLIPQLENFVETKAVKAYEDRTQLWLKTGYPVHIIGPTGCGKSTL
ncbi:MAG: gas vesicle protein GvpN, partial [bacterium]|nr:gas vesicle protein GvpN [bacterium]